MSEIVWKNPWSDRFLFLEKYIPNNLSIIDFGCGNQQILDYCKPSKYVGVDTKEPATIISNLNASFKTEEKFDLGLVLGLLEHLENPEYTLSQIHSCSNSFIILTSTAKMKSEWKHCFDKNKIEILLKKYFKNVKSDSYKRYTITLAENDPASLFF